MVLAVLIYVVHVMINLAIIHAQQPVALFVWLDGKAIIAQNVSRIFFVVVDVNVNGILTGLRDLSNGNNIYLDRSEKSVRHTFE